MDIRQLEDLIAKSPLSLIDAASLLSRCYVLEQQLRLEEEEKAYVEYLDALNDYMRRCNISDIDYTKRIVREVALHLTDGIVPIPEDFVPFPEERKTIPNSLKGNIRWWWRRLR